MSIDLAINNVGEYYSAHYLADNNGFAKDIRDKTTRWKEQGSQSTPRQLQSLADSYFKAKARALDYPEPELRSRADEPNISSWHPQLLQALGYQPEPFNLELPSEKQQLPVLLRLHRHSQPWMVIAQAPFCVTNGDWIEEPLEEMVEPTGETIDELPTCIVPWEQAIGLLFRQEDRPRWLMLLAGSRIYLFDAHSYSQGRYLYIDLDEAYARRDVASFNAIAALLAKETLAPTTESEDVLHEKLREGSLKSTHGVSEQLQGAVREAIELIANGWVEARRAGNQGYRQLNEREDPLPDGTRQVTAEQLKHDALVYVYRILFCLYGEARGGDLGILPITDDVYRLGYSLEALRDLADRGQPGTLSENGNYYAEHLTTLFRLVHQGFHPEQGKDKDKQGVRENSVGYQFGQGDMFGNVQGQLFGDDKKGPGKQIRTGTSKAFIIQPLTATLFDPAATPLLDRIKLSNRILQQVIRRLSLGTGSNNRQIGRINYAELGIVQLGSVYEGLLSYKGFFADEDLIQVCKKPKKTRGKPQPVVKDNAIDPKEPTWFVPHTRLDEFKEGEIIVEHRTAQPRIYKAGEFILHLNGVDRVNSASYYTPEVLTRALVKEALKERLKDFGPEQADDILNLKICEPAMGSAAFLVEAVDQLGRHYLELKQEQVGSTIDPSEFEAELRRVRHYIAVHNVYGVDLNPVAVELGALSLWLASIHSLKVQQGENGSADIYQPGQTPWFGLRLRAGNSLIGARRAVWTPGQLAAGRHYGSDAEAPRQLKPGEQRKPDEIYHFLVWDEDMAPAARDQLMKQYWPEECEAIKQWQTAQVKKNWSPEELAKGRDICKQIDVLWEDYAQHRIEGLARTECTATVWPTPSGDYTALKSGPSLAFQEKLKANLEAQSGAFQRLKLLMDSWCSFYFWPLEHSGDLPSRNAWLAAAEVLLGCEAVEHSETRAMLDITLGDEIDLEGLFAESQQKLPDADNLSAAVPWYEVARKTDDSQHFHHWELIFTEILGPIFEGQVVKPQGFDLMFGNPPWIKVTWNDAPLLSEYDPLLGVREAKSAKYNVERSRLLTDEVRKAEYRRAFELDSGNLIFLNDRTLYPVLAGMQTNLYKNFIERSWGLMAGQGIAALLHPEGVFDDPKGGVFREHYYKRLKGHYQFKNELMLFPDIGNRVAFSINIFGVEKTYSSFRAIFNLFDPNTIEKCQFVSPELPVPAIKTNEGVWETAGHPERILYIDQAVLELLARLFEDESTSPGQARLPQVHSQALFKVLAKFAEVPRRVGNLKGQYFATEMFHEANAQRNGIITREESPSYQPNSTDDWVISGPHFYVGNPLNKTPFTTVNSQRAYDNLDLTEIPGSYLPRAVYRPGDRDGNLEKFYAAIPEWPKPRKPEKNKAGLWQGGFWPVGDHEIPAYEVLLGHPLKRYGIDTNFPGAKTARKFGFFSRWEGDVEGAVAYLLKNNNKKNNNQFSEKFNGVRLEIAEQNEGDILLPKPLTAYPRHINRRRGQPANERTYIPSMIPAGPTHLDASVTLAFLSIKDLLCFNTASYSILMDFLVRSTGKGDCRHDLLKTLPFLESEFTHHIVIRGVKLAFVSSIYASLFESCKHFLQPSFIALSYENKLIDIPVPDCWNENFCYSHDYERWRAQIEIDVLVALSIGLAIDDLIQVYKVQFSALFGYEKVDQFDAEGRRLPNTARKDPGAKELREALNDHDGLSPVTITWEIDNGNQTVTKTFYPPFKHVDRIEDYKTAYRVFSERLGLNKNKEAS